MKTLIIALLTLTTTILTAQKTITWIGGTPGKETQWNEPRNWSNNKVPDEFSDVIIPDVSTTTFSFPIISEDIVEVNSLKIYTGASLKVESNARLLVYDKVDSPTNFASEMQPSIIVLNEDCKLIFNE